MRHYLARALYMILALAVLVSSTGLVVDRHYCGGKVRRMAVFFRASGCTPKEKTGCWNGGRCDGRLKLGRQRCCHNQMTFYQGEQDQKKVSIEDFTLKPQPCHQAIVLFFAACSIRLPEALESPYLRYKPPLRFTGVEHAWLQVFRL